MTKKSKISIRLGAGFFATICAAAVISLFAFKALKSLKKISEIVVSDYAEDLIDAGRLHADLEGLVSASRGYLITGAPYFLARSHQWREEFSKELEIIRTRAGKPEEFALLTKTEAAVDDYLQAEHAAFRLRENGEPISALVPHFEQVVMPQRNRLESAIDNYIGYCRDILARGKTQSDQAAADNVHHLLLIVVIALGMACSLAFLVTRTLSLLYAQVEEAVRMREEIVEVVSHDLKNPLAAVILNCELLKRDARSMSPEQLEKRIQTLNRAANGMKNLIYDLLDLSKLTAGTSLEHLRPQQAAHLIAEIIEIIQPQAAKKGIRLSSSIPESLPLVYCDRDRVLQVLSNLGGNAVKFVPQGGTISFSVKARNRELVFSVSDNGPGIPKEQLALIFDKYWQGATRKKEGTGLGLAIAKGIVEAHGGKIWAESSTHMGTIFFFTLKTQEFLLNQTNSRSTLPPEVTT